MLRLALQSLSSAWNLRSQTLKVTARNDLSLLEAIRNGVLWAEIWPSFRQEGIRLNHVVVTSTVALAVKSSWTELKQRSMQPVTEKRQFSNCKASTVKTTEALEYIPLMQKASTMVIAPRIPTSKSVFHNRWESANFHLTEQSAGTLR